MTTTADVLTGMNAFPITPFDQDGSFAPRAYRDVLGLICAGSPNAVFTGCGTGEFWSLSVEERIAIAEVALETLPDSVPVVVGWGGSDPGSLRALRTLSKRGVASVLLMPPDEWPWDPSGIIEYYRQLLEESSLPGIIYLKDHAGLDPGWWIDMIERLGAVGLKDGIGDHDFLLRLLAGGLAPERILNGTPTAEWFAPAYWAVGVRGYSSAVMNFAPSLARMFRDALEGHDEIRVRRLSQEFFWRVRQIRELSRSYAVSLVKAGVGIRGISVGRTRPPIGWPDDQTMRHVEQLVLHADALIATPESQDV